MKELESRDVREVQNRVHVRLARILAAGGRNYTFALMVHNLFNEQQGTRLQNNIERCIYGSVAVNFN
jgi:hypothetical protein